MKRLFKDKKAITLIALVITIVVLVILAVVTISLTVGNDGLIARAIKAAKGYKDAQEKEKQSINDLYGQLSIAADGTINNLTVQDLNRIIEEKVKTMDTTPIGTILTYAKAGVPSDKYMKCEGQSLSRTEYAELYAVIGTTYGSADESTFKLPDLRGEFLRGTGTNSHTNQGNGQNVGEHRDATSIPHIYTYRNVAGTGYGIGFRYDTELESNTAGTIIDAADAVVKRATTAKTAYVASDSQSASNASSNSLEFSVRPTNTAVQYCIKVK